MAKYYTQEIPKTDRIPRLVAHLYAKMPEIESARARLITESYKATEDKSIIMRRALAFAHILDNIPIIIREDELVVGSTTIAPRGCQTYPEFSYKWLESEFDTVVYSAAAEQFPTFAALALILLIIDIFVVDRKISWLKGIEFFSTKTIRPSRNTKDKKK